MTIYSYDDKVCCQGKRNDIIRELELLDGRKPEETCGHNDHKLKSRNALAAEYGFSSRNVARYLRLNHLIQPFKDLMDQDKIALLAAVDVSYLTEAEQGMLWQMVERQGLKVKPIYAKKLRQESGSLMKTLDPDYFTIIAVSDYDVTIMSRNTGHIWYSHNPEYLGEGTCIIFHKHRASHPYHRHGRAGSLRQAVKSIKGMIGGRWAGENKEIYQYSEWILVFLEYGKNKCA